MSQEIQARETAKNVRRVIAAAMNAAAGEILMASRDLDNGHFIDTEAVCRTAIADLNQMVRKLKELRGQE